MVNSREVVYSVAVWIVRAGNRTEMCRPERGTESAKVGPVPGDGDTERTYTVLSDTMLHVFGTSGSERMNLLLTKLGHWILEGSDGLARFERQWIEKTVRTDS